MYSGVGGGEGSLTCALFSNRSLSGDVLRYSLVLLLVLSLRRCVLVGGSHVRGLTSEDSVCVCVCATYLLRLPYWTPVMVWFLQLIACIRTLLATFCF